MKKHLNKILIVVLFALVLIPQFKFRVSVETSQEGKGDYIVELLYVDVNTNRTEFLDTVYVKHARIKNGELKVWIPIKYLKLHRHGKIEYRIRALG